jgi:hypothetical protein
VTRERIESKRLANDARQGVEGLPQISGSGCEVNPCVREAAQPGGNWARSSPTQPNSAPSRTGSSHPLGDMISGQSHGVAATDDRAIRFCRTSTATNRGGDVESIVTVRRSRLVGGGMALTGGYEDYGWKALAGRTGLPGTKGRGHPVPVGAAASAAAWARLSRHPRGVSFQISRCR